MPLTDDDLYHKVRKMIEHIPEDCSDVHRRRIEKSEDDLVVILRRFAKGWARTLDINTGWLPLVLDLDRKLSLLSPYYELNQIKEKFGGLRYYAEYKAPPGLNTHDNNTCSAIFYDLIQLAENKSHHICDECGQSGQAVVTHFGYHLTRCDKHHP